MMKLPAAAGGSAPVFRGGNKVTTTSTSSLTIPMHANTVEGDTVIVAVCCYGVDTTIAISGWTSLGHYQPVASIGFFEVFIKAGVTSGEAASGVTATIGATRESSAMSLTFDSGTLGAYDYAIDSAPVTSHAAPTISVDAGSTTAVVSCFPGRNIAVSSPTPDFYHNPNDHSQARTAAAFVFEDEAGPNNTSLTVTHDAARYVVWSIEIEAA